MPTDTRTRLRTRLPATLRRRWLFVAAGALGLVVLSACSSGASCAELEATALEAAAEYDAAAGGSAAEVEAKATFDQAIGDQIDLEC